MIELARRFGTQRLEAACQRALPFDDPKYRTEHVSTAEMVDTVPPGVAKVAGYEVRFGVETGQ